MARRPAQLPAGRHGLTRSFVASNQRKRMLAAVADTVAEKGYAGLTVADIVSRAGVSRRTFYDQFPDKRVAFFAAYDASVEQVMATAGLGFASSDHWPEQMRRALRAFLAYLAEDLPFARMAIIDIPLSGPEGQARHLAGRAGFELFLAPGAALADHPIPPLVPKAIGASVSELVRSRLITARAHTLPELLPTCLYQCLAPYLGIDVAARQARVAAQGLPA